MIKYIAITTHGKFIRMGEALSHGPRNKVTINLVDDIDRASVLPKMEWDKIEFGDHDAPAQLVSAVENRTVRITENYNDL